METAVLIAAVVCTLGLALLVGLALLAIIGAWMEIRADELRDGTADAPEAAKPVDLKCWHRQHRLHRYLDAHRKARP